MNARPLTYAIYALTTALGIGAFLYPFWAPVAAATPNLAHSQDAPLMLTVLVGLAFAVLLLEIQSQSISAKTVALLGVLVAINATLRFAEVAIPGPGGFSPIFFLIILTGYVFGGRFGFLMGVLTFFVSALITGGVGPWLPYQMFAGGWVGLSTPLCRPLVASLRGEGRRREMVVLAVFGGLWGLLFGAIMNIWFWPLVTGSSAQYWEPGISLAATLQRYALFYVATSLVWDSLALAGNVLMIVAFGMPTLRILRRFRQRFAFTHRPLTTPAHSVAPIWTPQTAIHPAPVAEG